MQDDSAGLVTVETRSLVVLDLEQLEQVDLLRRGSDDAEVAIAVCEQDPGGRSVEEVDTS